MSTQTEMAPESVAAEKPAKPETTYVVQAARTIKGLELAEGNPVEVDTVWVDIAKVTVAQRTPRKIVYRKALEASGIKPKPDSEPLRLRALDEASASEQPAEPVQPEPEWRVGS